MCSRDEDFSNVTCVDHFSPEELAAYHNWELSLRSKRPVGITLPTQEIKPDLDKKTPED